MRVEVASENALIIYFADEKTQSISEAVSIQVQCAAKQLEQQLSKVLVDLIPSYGSLLVLFDNQATDHAAIRKAIAECCLSADKHLEDTSVLIELPVYYGPQAGPDLISVAKRAKLSTEEVIALHSGQDYRVYAIGFAPGFAYLGKVNSQIATPRLSTPRLQVPKGSVGIADHQTAVYPSLSPGGWNLIGLCPTPLFDSVNEPHMPVKVGDRVRFVPIAREQFIQLGGQLNTELSQSAGRGLS